eukprot:8294460-Alexandrium_andersonii.AAC.1
MLAGRLRHRGASGSPLWTQRMVTGLDAGLRQRARPWAEHVALDALDYIKSDLLSVGRSGDAAPEGRGSDGQAQL